MKKKKVINLTEEEKIVNCHKMYEQMEIQLGRKPLPEEVATELGLPVERVEEYLLLKVVGQEGEEFGTSHELKFTISVKNNELEKVRKARKLRQVDVADKIGISMHMYSQIETCRHYPKLETRGKIADFYGKSIEQLFPEWLETFAKRWREVEKSRIVPINELSLSSPSQELLQLDSGDYENMIFNTEVDILNKHIKNAMEKVLSGKEKTVLELRYFKNLTLEDVGNRFGLTRERIRSIEGKALEKLRDSKLLENRFNEV